MTNKDFAALAKQLLPDLPGFAIRAPLIFIPPVQHTLRAICFERSSDKCSFYVWYFVQPLFVPAKYLNFLFGHRIRPAPGGGSWEADAPNLVRELGVALKLNALPFLSTIESPLDIVEVAMSLRRRFNPNVEEAIAYAFAHAGEVDKAVAEIVDLASWIDLEVPWEREIAERANALKSQLINDPPSAMKQLEAWEIETARNLGLEKFR